MCSLFEEACLNGDFECIIKLKIDLNLEKGFYNACKNGHYNIVKYLLNNFDINYRSKVATKPKIIYQEPLKVEIEHFVDCIINKSNCITGKNHSINVIKILEEACPL